MRIDGPNPGETLAFDNMEQRALRGATDWQRHHVVLDVDHRANAIVFGGVLVGEGELSVADFTFNEIPPDIPVTDSGFRLLAHPSNLDFTED